MENFNFDLTDLNQKCNDGIKADNLIRQMMGEMAADV
jgi:hypothetical protein